MKRGFRKNPVTVSPPWFALSLTMLRSKAFAQLSPHGTKLFLDLCSQLGGNSQNNGDLHCAQSVLLLRGWNSGATLRAWIYTHVLNRGGRGVVSPLDRLG